MSRKMSAFPVLPPLGIGCGTIALSSSQESFRDLVHYAVERESCYLDTAPLYAKGQSEPRLGEILRDIPRSRYVVSTKTGRYPAPESVGNATPIPSFFDYSHTGTLASLRRSLGYLGCGHIDIVFIHDLDRKHHGDGYPALRDQALKGALPALREAQEAGMIGHVGIASMEWEACLDLVEHADFEAVMIAGAVTLLDRYSAPLIDHCVRAEIDVIAASPFNSGILATGAIDGAVYNFHTAPPEILNRVRSMDAACRRFGVPLVAAALQYPGRQPVIRSLVAGHASREQYVQNRHLMSIAIPDALWDELDAL
ncbi:D-threo-aldose 1-dehydrogenase (plasmid) [Shinella sp. WSC3-e]|nr:D-threo-aldose 1-dehydrogenase [Shinella sp. WSC3-e]